jgi:glycosyltransferase 2 family protein
LLLPGALMGKFVKCLASLPKVGPAISHFLVALTIYRSRPAHLGAAVVLSVAVQSMFVLALDLMAFGLFPQDAVPTLAEHFVMVPLAMLTGILPVPGGLGAFEAALEYLYRYVPATKVPIGHGLLVALAFRLITMVITGIGIIFYVASRKQISATLAEESAATDLQKRPPAYSSQNVTAAK